jgi:ribosomal protein S18 acetylase RimI-like enzyme
MMIKVRSSNAPPDKACFARLSKNSGLSFEQPPDEDLLKKLKGVFWVVAENNQEQIGLLRLSLRVPGISFISNFVVDPAHQGKGIGSKMLLAAEKLCMKHEEFFLVLESVASAEAYYLKRGFIKKQAFPPTFTKTLVC